MKPITLLLSLCLLPLPAAARPGTTDLVAAPQLGLAAVFGGNDDDVVTCSAVDRDGNIVVAGFTKSQNFPTAHALDATLDGANDAFVAKISADGSTLLYATYL